MILRRLGNKKKVAKDIIQHFPPHKVYLSPFFGAGGIFFNKPKAKYNLVNDLDSDVFNLFQVVMNQKQELEEAFYMMPIHSDLLEYWKKNEETEPVKKALRFLFLSNLIQPTTGDILRKGYFNSKEITANGLKDSFDFLKNNNIRFFNEDFRKFISLHYFQKNRPLEKINTFIYNDPPYQNTSDNYSHSFTKQDLIDLIEVNIETGCKFAISEFNSDVVLELAKQYELEVITIGERQNLKNRRTEILLVNYRSQALYGLFGYQNGNKC
jgi:DNA adenine methylase